MSVTPSRWRRSASSWRDACIGNPYWWPMFVYLPFLPLRSLSLSQFREIMSDNAEEQKSLLHTLYSEVSPAHLPTFFIPHSLTFIFVCVWVYSFMTWVCVHMYAFLCACVYPSGICAVWADSQSPAIDCFDGKKGINQNTSHNYAYKMCICEWRPMYITFYFSNFSLGHSLASSSSLFLSPIIPSMTSRRPHTEQPFLSCVFRDTNTRTHRKWQALEISQLSLSVCLPLSLPPLSLSVSIFIRDIFSFSDPHTHTWVIGVIGAEVGVGAFDVFVEFEKTHPLVSVHAFVAFLLKLKENL